MQTARSELPLAERRPQPRGGPEAHIVVPKWFLGFLSAVVTLVSIAVVPWAASVTQTLTTLSVEMAGLRARFDGRDALQEEVIRGLNQRMSRIESALDRLEREAGRPYAAGASK